jgi:hypothetical protein
MTNLDKVLELVKNNQFGRIGFLEVGYFKEVQLLETTMGTLRFQVTVEGSGNHEIYYHVVSKSVNDVYPHDLKRLNIHDKFNELMDLEV